MNRISHATEHKERGLETLSLPIHEMFTSIEGEGPEVGTPTLFVRTAGCNFKCSFCDTRKSWDLENSDTIAVSELVRLVEGSLCSCVRRVSITGGNPALHKDEVLALITALQSPGRCFNLEHPGLHSYGASEEFEFIRKLCEATVEGSRFHLSMDVKIPLWCQGYDSTNGSYLGGISRLIAHNVLLKAIEGHSDRCSASVKVLVQNKGDFDFFADNVDVLTEGLHNMNISYWVALVRGPQNEVDRSFLGYVTHGLSYHPAFSRVGKPHVTWRLNPNLHVQLGIR